LSLPWLGDHPRVAIWSWKLPWRPVPVYEGSPLRVHPCYVSCPYSRCRPQPPWFHQRSALQCAYLSPLYPVHLPTSLSVSLTYHPTSLTPSHSNPAPGLSVHLTPYPGQKTAPPHPVPPFLSTLSPYSTPLPPFRTLCSLNLTLPFVQQPPPVFLTPIHSPSWNLTIPTTTN